jgi:hypothetical protein
VTGVQALLRRETIDLALDGEQDIDALDRLDGDRRFADAGEVEEVAPRTRPAGRLNDRTSLRLAP